MMEKTLTSNVQTGTLKVPLKVQYQQLNIDKQMTIIINKTYLKPQGSGRFDGILHELF